MAYFKTSADYIKTLLSELGLESILDIFKDIPKELILKQELELESGLEEWDLVKHFSKLASENNFQMNNFKGAGVYRHHVPSLVKYISSRGEFLTAYTPYQAEVSQGSLEAIYLFQSFIADITGMDYANASMYDGATAFAEAITMSYRLNKKRKIFLLGKFHPEYLAVLDSYTKPLEIEYQLISSLDELEESSTLAIQNPNFHGEQISNKKREILKSKVAELNLFLIYTVSEALAMFSDDKASELGAEIVCGSAQSFGNPVFYGGAQVGFISSKLAHIRQLPGRVVGKTSDRRGNEAYVLTFQTREQHIKRDRASSNICTNQSIHALCTATYLKLMGKSGLEKVVKENKFKSEYLKHLLNEFIFIESSPKQSFNEFLVSLSTENEKLIELFTDIGVSLTVFNKNSTKEFLITVTELNSESEIENFIEQINEISASKINFNFKAIKAEVLQSLDIDIDMNRYQFKDETELEVCRYFTNLSKLNFSIDTNFYPLGSCTMKHNPKVNDEIASNHNWTEIHPYEKDSNSQGVLKIYQDLNRSLCEITGFDQFSLEPAAGAQGEFSALLMAKKYFKDINENRNIVIVPDSAHGTNPASAVMTGFKVITVKSAEDGDVDMSHLKEICEKHKESIAVFMLTNPNTLGIFSSKILEITSSIHDCGGLMYYDGANLNAIVGVSRPGDMGFDLIHLNVHKTFSTPHGGGGPGAGPVGAKRKLCKYLPGPQININSEGNLFWDSKTFKESSIGKIRSFHGNFNVLIRALAYIKANGREGIAMIGKVASLHANYLQEKIRQSPILSGTDFFKPYFNKLCKHEFIISVNKLKKEFNISALDIAKRLLDKGIHAPTIYFPTNIPECLMIEPTETESKDSLDSLVKAFEEIITEAQSEAGREIIKTAPHSTKFSRFDEVKAIKEPILSKVMEVKGSVKNV